MSATNSAGTTSAGSDPTLPVVVDAPRLKHGPYAVGKAIVKMFLNARAVWTGSPWEWRYQWRVRVTAHNAAGHSTATSKPTHIVAK